MRQLPFICTSEEVGTFASLGWGELAETAGDSGGGSAEFRGIGLGLAFRLACPEYLAKIACLLARRAAMTSSTGGGVEGISSSISA